MNEKNHSDIGRAMNFILRPMLAAGVQRQLARHFGANSWWQRGVLDVLYEEKKRNLPAAGTYEELTDKLDVQLCLLLIEIHWREVFSLNAPRDYFNWIKELQSIRNRWAHEQSSFDDATTIRALDTMAQISKIIDAETTEKLRAMWSAKLNRKSEPAAVVNQREEIFTTTGNLKAWRNVIEPHPDVARGRYKQAEFAADLAQVVRGEVDGNFCPDDEDFSAAHHLNEGSRISGNFLIAPERLYTTFVRGLIVSKVRQRSSPLVGASSLSNAAESNVLTSASRH